MTERQLQGLLVVAMVTVLALASKVLVKHAQLLECRAALAAARR